MKPNTWGVEPGQTWVHPDTVLLVIDEAVGREWFRCLVLDADPKCWIFTTGPRQESITILTAYLIAKGGKLV